MSGYFARLAQRASGDASAAAVVVPTVTRPARASDTESVDPFDTPVPTPTANPSQASVPPVLAAAPQTSVFAPLVVEPRDHAPAPTMEPPPSSARAATKLSQIVHDDEPRPTPRASMPPVSLPIVRSEVADDITDVGAADAVARPRSPAPVAPPIQADATPAPRVVPSPRRLNEESDVDDPVIRLAPRESEVVDRPPARLTLEPLHAEAPPVAATLPEAPRLVIGRMRVEVTAAPMPAPIAPLPSVAERRRPRGGLGPRGSSLYFGLGQM